MANGEYGLTDNVNAHELDRLKHQEREQRLRAMIWRQGQLIGTHKDCPDILWFVVDGKVYCDLRGEHIEELGDYFLFVEGVRINNVPGFTPAESLATRIHDNMKKHFDLANRYERQGNTQGSMHLRYVGNLLAAFLRGQTPSTILPDN